MVDLFVLSSGIALVITFLLFSINRSLYRFLSYCRLDHMTGLYRRDFYELKLNLTFGRAVIVLDIDEFKRINDQYGHQQGDVVIKEVCHRIKQHMRRDDMAIRWGGEEFSLVMPGVDVQRATEICERIRQQIQHADYSHLGFGLTLTVSTGISGSVALDDYRRLLIEADKALYQAKSTGRNSVRVWKSPPGPTPIGSKSA